MSARLLVLAACALLGGAVPSPAAPVAGSEGGLPTSPHPGIPQERRIEQDVLGSQTVAQREVPGSIQVDGVVTVSSGAPLAGVRVKVFTNGVVTSSAVTETDGTFTVRANPPVSGNNTTVVWFESPDPDRYLDSEAVLFAGTVARELRLFPPCVQRIEYSGNNAHFEVTMRTLDERKAALEQSHCLEQER